MRNILLAGVSMIALTVAGGAMAAQNLPANAPVNAPGNAPGNASAMMTAPSSTVQATRSESSAGIKMAQEKLKSENMYKGHVDGIAGPEMAKGLKNFQKKNNLEQTSQLDEPTKQKLGIIDESGATIPPGATIPSGSTLPSVSTLPPATPPATQH